MTDFLVANIERLLDQPSISAVAFQAESLRRELTTISTDDFPKEACRIRDVFFVVVEHARLELAGLQQAVEASGTLTEDDHVRFLYLADIFRTVSAHLRYLKASAPTDTPPALQEAMSQQADALFAGLDLSPTALIRPQWTYNFKYVAITSFLENKLNPALLDPRNEIPHEGSAIDSEPFFHQLWLKYEQTLLRECYSGIAVKLEYVTPRALAVLSFARLDTEDCLLFPLLAHELGHFVDFSVDGTLHVGIAEAVPFDIESIQKELNLGVDEAVGVAGNLDVRYRVCLREIFADLLAARTLGLGFFLAQAEFLKTVGPVGAESVEDTGYPSTSFRLRLILEEVQRDSGLLFVDLLTSSEPHGSTRGLRPGIPVDDIDVTDVARTCRAVIALWRDRLEQKAHSEADSFDPMTTSSASRREALLLRHVKSALPLLRCKLNERIKEEDSYRVGVSVLERVLMLNSDLPPSLEEEGKHSFADVLTAAWLYQLAAGEEREALAAEEGYEQYRKTCRLVLKAIELLPLVPLEKQTAGREAGSAASGAGVLGEESLRTRLAGTNLRGLRIIPLRRHDGSTKSPINEASVDLHLGNWFSVPKRTRMPSQVLSASRLHESRSKRIDRDETFVKFGSTFVIHPGDFVLGTTLEFVAIPNNLMGYVEGRSRVGRAGLLVATAAPVAPGFHGVLVLELANTGTVPLEIEPGLGVAQLVLLSLSESVTPYRGQYQCQIKPIP